MVAYEPSGKDRVADIVDAGLIREGDQINASTYRSAGERELRHIDTAMAAKSSE